MGFMIMAYAGNALQEYYLPAIDNSNYVINLNEKLFKMADNISLNMEIISKQWKFVQSDSYEIFTDEGDSYEGQHLCSGDLYILTVPTGEQISLIVSEYDEGHLFVKKYSLKGMNEIRIGTDSNAELKYSFMNYISKRHAIIYKSNNGWYVSDTSSNGTFMNGERIGSNVLLRFGDSICIYGLKIVFLDDMLAVSAYSYKDSSLSSTITEYHKSKPSGNIPAPVKEKKFFKRSPRTMEKPFDEVVEVEAPPSPEVSQKSPLFLTIGPSFTMVVPMLLGSLLTMVGSQSGSGVYMLTGVVTALGSAMFGVFWALSNIKYTKKMEKEKEELRFNSYGQYLINIANFLREKYEYNSRILNEMYISSEQCVYYDENSVNLWNRNITHDDFLAVRLGVGNMPFQVDIHVPQKKFSIGSDELANKPFEIKSNYETLYNVPICMDMHKNQMLGIVGGYALKGAKQAVLDIVTQIAVNNCYTDVKLVFIYDEEQDGDFWKFAKWLPHVWTEDKKCRLVAGNKAQISELSFELSKILRDREEKSQEYKSQKEEKLLPHYIIFIENRELLEGELLLKYIMSPKPCYGITSVFLTEEYAQLPNSCENIIENNSVFSGFYNVTESRRNMQAVQFDIVSAQQVEMLARRLSGIEVNEDVSNGEIPNALNFLEMYNVTSLKELDVVERWTKNRTYDSMKVIIGRKGGNKDCFLDIHEKFHGPHGLVAGTTGSGKSETLQTYMLSLAVNFSPDDIVFLIIDFKGGGMANLFSNLPHLAGKISNLSGNQVKRAMISIKSENKRRQRIFNENNVNNINLYTRLYKNHEATIPVPHLFIIIDEFAELKREEPEFMKELISVAQVGRSLGVHLILATQKPSGTVDDNIWSNTKFRLCLRVQDKQDSNDMLHKPDAAYLTQAGRCYLQVGNDELYEQFQSGYSGATYSSDMTESKANVAAMLSLTGRANLVSSKMKKKKEKNPQKPKEKEITQLDAVIQYLNETAAAQGYEEVLQLWKPVLPLQLFLESLEGYKDTAFDGNSWQQNTNQYTLCVPIGLYDDMENQQQQPLYLDFVDGGHLGICGMVSTGKSTFLQTLIYSLMSIYTPAQVNFYLIDFSSRMLSAFEGSVHVGGVMYDSDEEKIRKFFNMLICIMDERKNLFKGGNYEQYVRVHGQVLPAIIIALDNFNGFAEKTEEEYDSVLLRLAKEGVSYGMYFVTTASGISNSELPSRIADNMRTFITLDLGDKFKFSDILHTTVIPILPEQGVKGRGLANVNGRLLEYQTALSLEASDDYDRQEKIKDKIKHFNHAWHGITARRIPEIPQKPILTEFSRLAEYKQACEDNYSLPVGYIMADASIYSIDLRRTYCYLFSGRKRSGKTNMLKITMAAASKKPNARVILIENTGNELKKYAQELGVDYIAEKDEIIKFFTETVDIFKKRNVLKHQLINAGEEDAAIYERMQEEEKYFVFIANLTSFIKQVYDVELNMGLAPYLENITEKGFLHNFYFFGCINSDDSMDVVGLGVYNNMMSYKTGIHFGGYIDSQKLFNFTDIPYTEQSKPMKLGLALVAQEEDPTLSRQVVIPQAK